MEARKLTKPITTIMFWSVAMFSTLGTAAGCSDAALNRSSDGAGAATTAGAPAQGETASPTPAPVPAPSMSAPSKNGSAPVSQGQLPPPAATPPAKPADGPPPPPLDPPAMPAREDANLPALCSGCAEQEPNPTDTSIHLHHVHMNVSDRDASTSFYEKFLAAKRVQLNQATEALQTTPTLLLLDDSNPAPISALPTALQHVGWGTADLPGWYEQARADGILPDTRGGTLFNTLDTPTIGGPGEGGEVVAPAPACFPRQDRYGYIYVRGPDDERIEVWTGAHERVNHVHFTTANLRATATWYQNLLGVTGTTTREYYLFYLDDILFFFEPIGTPADYEPTDDHVLGHIAFSVTDLEVWLERATEQNLEVVAQPAEVHGFKSFFVRGPDGMLIELVQATPHAALCPASN